MAPKKGRKDRKWMDFWVKKYRDGWKKERAWGDEGKNQGGMKKLILICQKARIIKKAAKVRIRKIKWTKCFIGLNRIFTFMRKHLTDS